MCTALTPVAPGQPLAVDAPQTCRVDGLFRVLDAPRGVVDGVNELLREPCGCSEGAEPNQLSPGR